MYYTLDILHCAKCRLLSVRYCTSFKLTVSAFINGRDPPLHHLWSRQSKIVNGKKPKRKREMRKEKLLYFNILIDCFLNTVFILSCLIFCIWFAILACIFKKSFHGVWFNSEYFLVFGYCFVFFFLIFDYELINTCRGGKESHFGLNDPPLLVWCYCMMKAALHKPLFSVCHSQPWTMKGSAL